MRRLRTLTTSVAVVLTVAALAGCGRKTVPVATRADGQPARVVVPAPDGTARLPRVAPVTSDLSVLPTEITRNPGAPPKRFALDGLLN